MAKPIVDNLKMPVCAAPMFLVSGPELVLAACRSGMLGAFPTPNARTTEDLAQWMEQISTGIAAIEAETGRPAPWAANLVTHSTNARLPDDLALIARYRPPVVITALGSPKPALETVHAYGGVVLADVTTMALARKAIAAGVDGLVCVCAGAGGHTGSLSPFAFISAVRAEFDGLIMAGGGIADGWGVAGVIAAGADIGYIGTRFIPSHESLADAEHKRLVISESIDGLIVSDAITGASASWIKASLRSAGIDPDTLKPGSAVKDYDSSKGGDKKRWKEIFAAGQGLGASQKAQSVAEIAVEIEREYRAAARRLAQLNDAPHSIVEADESRIDLGAVSISP